MHEREYCDCQECLTFQNNAHKEKAQAFMFIAIGIFAIALTCEMIISAFK